NMRLKGRSAIVTGSSRGIGRAVALRFAQEGAKVVVNYVGGKERAETVAKEIRAGGGEAVVGQAGGAQGKGAERLIGSTIKEFGKVDILVSNAGIVLDRSLVDSTDEDWERAIGINLTGFFNVTRAVLPHMIERKSGRVIATGSCITEVADFGGSTYPVCAASK